MLPAGCCGFRVETVFPREAPAHPFTTQALPRAARSFAEHREVALYGAEAVVCAVAVGFLLTRSPQAQAWVGLPLGHAVMTCGRAFMNGTTTRVGWATTVNEAGSIYGMLGIVIGAFALPLWSLSAAALGVATIVGILLAKPRPDYGSFRRRRIILMAPIAAIMWVEALIGAAQMSIGPAVAVIVGLQALVLGNAFRHRQSPDRRRVGHSSFVPMWRCGVLFVVLTQSLSVALRSTAVG